jgi:hypothetical protein
MQDMGFDDVLELMVWNQHESFWSQDGERVLRRNAFYDEMQKMTSSNVENNLQRYHNEIYYNSVLKFRLKEQEESQRWEEIFEADNGFYFEKDVWRSFLKLNPTIKVGDQWVKILKKKKRKDFYWNRKIIMKASSWEKLKKIAAVISFVEDFDSIRNNKFTLV